MCKLKSDCLSYCHMSYVEPGDMLTNFCFGPQQPQHPACECTNHRAGSQLKRVPWSLSWSLTCFYLFLSIYTCHVKILKSPEIFQLLLWTTYINMKEGYFRSFFYNPLRVPPRVDQCIGSFEPSTQYYVVPPKKIYHESNYHLH